MDDTVTGHSTLEDLLHLKEEAIIAFKSCGMNLRGFISVPEAHKHWSAEPPPDTVKVLGVKWSPSSDSILMVPVLKSAKTRREILSSLSSIFDPLGLRLQCQPLTCSPRKTWTLR